MATALGAASGEAVAHITTTGAPAPPPAGDPRPLDMMTSWTGETRRWTGSRQGVLAL